ncbi:sigma-54-dependent transcriptional regulator [Sphingosinithalassobacter portus]|uniref:sigma-54-dependent transcriptional regulator n=1 Tax=Stakelama portus TaxID=2676234 RepID=UPI000D6E88E7|nr:response regulator [Sphingosinithalassobacter portus]
MSNDTSPPAILFIDDDPDIVKAARLLLERRGMALTGAASPDAAWPLLAEHRYDAVLLDLNFARGRTTGEEGFAMLDRLTAADRDLAVVVVTGHSGINIAVQAMRAGAADFVIKPWSNERLLATIERAVALSRARRRVIPTASDTDRLIIGEAPAIQTARDRIAQVAATAAPVLIRGPAGSGKSLFADVLHNGSQHAERPPALLACAAVKTMAAIDAALAQAAGGTLILDAVDALAPELQLQLASRLSQTRPIATSRHDRATLAQTLAPDLLYRINTIEIDLPPLVERSDDVLLLARYFADRFAARYGKPARSISETAAAAIAADRWPDNVRGLRQVVERAVLLGTGDALDLADFQLETDAQAPAPRAIASDLNLERSERLLVEAALKRNGFNVSRAAGELGLTRAALYRRMAKYGL